MTIDERLKRLRWSTKKQHREIKLLHQHVCEFGEQARRRDQQEQASLAKLRMKCLTYLESLLDDGAPQ